MTPTNFFLPKEDQDLPDQYGVSVFFHDGKSVDYEVASHRFIECVRIPNPQGLMQDANGRFNYTTSPAPQLELFLKEDETVLIPVASYRFIKFDKRWSKIQEIYRKARKNVESSAKDTN